MAEKLYPCEDCGKLRTKDEGGTIFTVCDECWDRHYVAQSQLAADKKIVYAEVK